MFSRVKGKANPRGLKGFIPSLISDEAGFISQSCIYQAWESKYFSIPKVLIRKKPGLKLIDINM